MRPTARYLLAGHDELPLGRAVALEGTDRQLRAQIRNCQDRSGALKCSRQKDEIGGARIQPSGEGLELAVEPADVPAGVLQSLNRKFGKDANRQPWRRGGGEVICEHGRPARGPATSS